MLRQPGRLTVEPFHGGRNLFFGDEFLSGDLPSLDAFYRKHLSGFVGNVLVGGLGFGKGVEYLCGLPAVESVTVCELRHDVIRDYGFAHPKLSIVHADIWNWDGIYDCVFLDIWGYVDGKEQECADLAARFPSTQTVCLPLLFLKI